MSVPFFICSVVLVHKPWLFILQSQTHAVFAYEVFPVTNALAYPLWLALLYPANMTNVTMFLFYSICFIACSFSAS